MDRRLTVLETRFDTILPTLATKSDVEALRAEVHVIFQTFQGEFRSENEKLRGEFRGENEKLRGDMQKAINGNTKFIIGVVVTLFLGVLAVNVNMFNALNSRLAGIESRLPAAQQGPTSVQPPPVSPRTNAGTR